MMTGRGCRCGAARAKAQRGRGRSALLEASVCRGEVAVAMTTHVGRTRCEALRQGTGSALCVPRRRTQSPEDIAAAEHPFLARPRTCNKRSTKLLLCTNQ